PGEAGDPLARSPRLGPLTRLAQIIQWSRPHRIVVAVQERRGALPCRPLLDARLRGIQVEDGAELYERLTGRIAIEALTPSSVIFSRDFRPRRLAPAGRRAPSAPPRLS